MGLVRPIRLRSGVRRDSKKPKDRLANKNTPGERVPLRPGVRSVKTDANLERNHER